jgi:hypothetical protein
LPNPKKCTPDEKYAKSSKEDYASKNGCFVNDDDGVIVSLFINKFVFYALFGSILKSFCAVQLTFYASVCV